MALYNWIVLLVIIIIIIFCYIAENVVFLSEMVDCFCRVSFMTFWRICFTFYVFYSYCAVHCMVLRSAGDYGRRSWAIPWFAEKNVLVRWTSSAYVRSSTRSNSFQLVLRVRQFHNVCRTAKNIIISLYVSEGVPCGAF